MFNKKTYRFMTTQMVERCGHSIDERKINLLFLSNLILWVKVVINLIYLLFFIKEHKTNGLFLPNINSYKIYIIKIKIDLNYSIFIKVTIIFIAMSQIVIYTKIYFETSSRW